MATGRDAVVLSSLELQFKEFEARLDTIESKIGGKHQASVNASEIHVSLSSLENARDVELLKKFLAGLSRRVETLEDLHKEKLSQLDRSQGDARSLATAGPADKKDLERELRGKGVSPVYFVSVPADYYEQDLEYRRKCLAAASIQHLCKSIILENTRAPAEFLDCGNFSDSRYYCVIVQYAARLHAEKIKRFLHKLNGSLGVKFFNMRLAPTPDSDRLTGYLHNAVTPICMRTRLPIILSNRIEMLEPDIFWLGAGETDLKVGMSTKQFIAAYKPMVIDCTYQEDPVMANSNCLSS